ncbi:MULTISPECIES: RluA family pseudouridine synthase [Cetobacterium]|jgi:23S rRNA pseudouridine955/2504/2580 synthase|uniref:RluA family pseudouridine synthase n=1 Tax=Candidatus Cetobacterium colombiensis TaxID=3073100 RepID=A0ABU4WCN5_9FUSO|nr:RluA family pseudouridine synthase [Candidatus Cetobacterium colombiensis]MDX8336336.1 RluA family pseudouridine synthase [Candidatus Cetobacterium colombiensis]
MEYIIDSSFNEVRLDRFLRKKYENTPLTEIFKGIRTGKIKVNGKKSKENYRLKEGDIVKVLISGGETEVKSFIKISNKDLEILKSGIVFEDDKVVIFNKKADMVMHKGSGHEYGISELFKSYYKTDEFNFVNRIDKSTSGLVIGAKTLSVTRELAEEVREGNTEKKYYILVDGVVNQKDFTIKSYLKKEETKVIELDKYEIGSKESISYFKVLKRGKSRTILEAKLETGRTHQLRVQLSSLGHPIVGDGKYGKGGKSMFLFSYYCEIPKYDIKIELPLPEEFISNVK